MEFFIYGHKNLLGTHKNTLEFTKDKELTLNGDCIIGVNSNFNITDKIMSSKKIRVVISVDDIFIDSSLTACCRIIKT